ncbi:polysaccharide deacetylase family protein [Streptomyces sp. NA04227]|uniref:polysaccharide deacetylase family protein n=1 Tax=Streptomyces sp. NA04227 TaxID=2742136 RepID=UPI0015917502|nr:polysaccharide deacetylase family protein [Streptomyces sp. NA04227]QKW08651.1 polysaccharide deacetylase family protein [Streptomyces sp. NA04227]
MRLVRQAAQRAGWWKRQARCAAALLALGALAIGCAALEYPQPIEGIAGAPGAHGPPAGGGAPARGAPARGAPARPLDSYASLRGAERSAQLAAALRWRLMAPPRPAPPPPDSKPRLRTRKGFEVDGGDAGLPPVFTGVPTKEKIVFLTIDDGYEKDPAFLRMTSELRIPYSAFLSDYVIKDDYAYFRRMRDSGVTLSNHTLHHPDLRELSYAEQRREICGMQDVMAKEFGRRPTLLRPPFGNYDRDTLRAAKSCGIKAIPLWNEEIVLDRMEYRDLDKKLHPGDIVLTHFRGRGEWRGTMPDMLRNFLKELTKQGFAVARLEDYV